VVEIFQVLIYDQNVASHKHYILLLVLLVLVLLLVLVILVVLLLVLLVRLLVLVVSKMERRLCCSVALLLCCSVALLPCCRMPPKMPPKKVALVRLEPSPAAPIECL
jgi:hypothetical protein